MTIISRRQFLKAAGITSITLFIGGGLTWYIGSQTTADLIKAVINKKLYFLNLDENGIDSFVLDHLSYINKKTGSDDQGGIAYLTPLYKYLDLFNLINYPKSFSSMEIDIAKKYLISTDFFLNDADEHRKIMYIKYYDPGVAGCNNPFARLK